jgi:hypothetical protein
MSAGKGDMLRAVNGEVYRRNYNHIYGRKYPEWICATCGCLHGNNPTPTPHFATWHYGKCGICGAFAVEVTEPRDFGHLRKGWDK